MIPIITWTAACRAIASGCGRYLLRAVCVLTALFIGTGAAWATPQGVDVTLTSTVNPSVTGQPTTFTATVGSPGASPEGTFNLFDGTTPIDTGAVNTTGAGNTTGIGNSLGLGSNHTCVVGGTGGVKCWGVNDNGQLGNGDFDSNSHPVPIDISGLSGVRALSAGIFSTCALTNDGTVKCWGLAPTGVDKDDGARGYADGGSAPSTLAGVSNARMIASGGIETADDVVCVVTTDDAVKCAGVNSTGYISAADTTTISGLESGVGSVAVSETHACAVMLDGSIKCWGGASGAHAAQSGTTLTTITGFPLTTTATAVTAGFDFSCALLNTGEVWCWGRNDEGELGDGSNTTTTGDPVNTGLSNVKAISAGTIHACALISDGTMKCWGDNSNGELGDNSTTNRNAPVFVTNGVTNISGVSAIAAGGNHTCAIVNTGVTKCWGSNGHGQVGDNSTTDRHQPTDVNGTPSVKLYGQITSSLAFLSAGSHSLTAQFVPSNSSLFNNGSGLLTQTVNKSATTTTLSFVSGTNPSQFGDSQTFGIVVAPVAPGNGTPSGTVNLMDGLDVVGTGTLSSGATNISVSTLPLGARAITAAYQGEANYTASTSDSTSTSRTQTVSTTQSVTALATSGSPTLFGQSVMFTATVTSNPAGAGGAATGTISFKDGSGEIGTGTLSGGVATFTTTALARGSHTITADYPGDGTYLASGSGNISQIINKGSTTTTLVAKNAPTPLDTVGMTATVAPIAPSAGIPTGSVAFSIDGGSAINVALADGRASLRKKLTVGNHSISASYLGDTNYMASTALPTSASVSNVKAATTTTLMRLSPSTNSFGSSTSVKVEVTTAAGGPATGSVTIKDGATTLATVNLDAFNPSSAFSAGDFVTCMIGAGGGAKCWGWQAFGVLGDGVGNSSGVAAHPAPVDVLGLTSGVQSISSGGFVSCAVTAAGGLKCWGLNHLGNLGNGTTFPAQQPGDASPPNDVLGLTTGVSSVSTRFTTCALTTGGGVKCWGPNDRGSLGTDDATSFVTGTPVDVAGLSSGVKTLGDLCAIMTTGGVKCWGPSPSGDLGTGASDNDPHPVTDVPGVSGAFAIAKALSSSSVCALIQTGGAKCWGLNSHGELGIGSVDSTVHGPTDATDLADVVQIAGFGLNFCGVTSGGAVKCWGESGVMIGNGSSDAGPHLPTLVPIDETAVAVSVGDVHVCALTTTGGLKCWGDNRRGQLGVPVGPPDPNLGFDVRTTPVDAQVPAIPLRTTVTFSTSALGGGSRSLTAVYNGDEAHTGSTSGSLTQTVTNAPTTTTLASSANPSVTGQQVTLTATIASTGAPGGSVTFKEGTTTLGSAPVSAGQAILTISSLPFGSHDITASYSGDAFFNASSTATPLTQTVKNATMLSLQPTPSSTVVGQAVAFTATLGISASAVGTPTGSITFMDGGTTLGAANLSGMTASLSTASLAIGTHNISAVYGGDSNFGAATAAPTTFTVAKGMTTLTASGSPSPAKRGQALTLNATVSAITPATATPTGSVTFKDGSTTLGSATVASGAAQLSTSSLTLGNHVITASYGGDSNLAGSSATTTATISAALGAETKVNTTTKGAQQFPAVAALKSGYVVAWASKGEDKSGYGVYAQRYSAAGAKLGGETLVNTFKTKDQTQPAVAGLKSGGFVVVWQSTNEDMSGLGVYAQLYDKKGKKSGTEFKVNTTTSSDQSLASVAPLASGGFVVAWTSSAQDGSGLGIYAQLFDAGGMTSGAEFKVNTTIKGDQSNPSVAGLTGGGFVIAWQGPDKSGLGVYAQRYDASGKAQGKETLVNKTTLHDQSLPSVTSLDNGGFVVAWQSADASGLGAYMQRFTNKGVKAGGETLVNTMTVNDQATPSVAAFSDGGYVIAWVSNLQDGSGQGVYAQAYTDAGAKADVEFLVNTTTDGNQNQPAVAAFAAGNFIVVWTSADDGGGQGIYSQRFMLPGTN